jgi:predicted nuclease with TOPRIM domain
MGLEWMNEMVGEFLKETEELKQALEGARLACSEMRDRVRRLSGELVRSWDKNRLLTDELDVATSAVGELVGMLRGDDSVSRLTEDELKKIDCIVDTVLNK